MPTEPHPGPDLGRLASLVFAVAAVACALIAGNVGIAPPWDKAAHFALFSLITLLLLQAAGTGMRLPALAAAAALGALDAWRRPSGDAADFLANLSAAVVTGALILVQRKTPCAESSPR